MFKVVDTPSALPGSCYLCGSGEREKYLDFGTSIEFHGALYICDICMFSAAKMFGFMSASEINELTNENKDLLQQNILLNLQVDSLNEALQKIMETRFGTGVMTVVESKLSNGITDSPMDSDSTDIPSSVESTEQVVESGQDSMESEGTESFESSDDEGMADIRSIGDTEFSFTI